MKKILLIIFFLFFSASSFAQAIRHTSFDDRASCEDDRGTWREYGNSCVDLCEAKLDRFMICAQSITYGCQCGKGRCWDGAHCAVMKDYKKNYDEEYAKEQEKLKEVRKDREDEYEANSQKILQSLFAKSMAPTQQQANGQQGGQPQSNIADFYKPEEANPAPPSPPPSQNSFMTKVSNGLNLNQSQQAKSAQQNPTPSQQPVLSNQSAATSVQPTQDQLNQMPFYQKQAMEQEIAKKSADQENAAKNQSNAEQKDEKKSGDKSDEGLAFPILPLPTN